MLKQLYVLFQEALSFRNSSFSKDFISYQNILDLVAVLATIVYCSMRIANPFGAYLNPELV